MARQRDATRCTASTIHICIPTGSVSSRICPVADRATLIKAPLTVLTASLLTAALGVNLSRLFVTALTLPRASADCK